MDIRLQDGAQALDGRGLPQSITGDEELLQRALIRLAVRRGSLPEDPQLGSRLHELRRSGVARLEQLALGYAQDALAPMIGVQVENAVCRYDEEEDRLEVLLTLQIEDRVRELTVTI